MYDVTAPYTALNAEPMTVSEIDSHPDADRIWATLEALKRESYTREEEALDKSYESYDDDLDAARVEGRENGVHFMDCLEINFVVSEEGNLIMGITGVIEDYDEDTTMRELLEERLNSFTVRFNEQYEL